MYFIRLRIIGHPSDKINFFSEKYLSFLNFQDDTLENCIGFFRLFKKIAASILQIKRLNFIELYNLFGVVKNYDVNGIPYTSF